MKICCDQLPVSNDEVFFYTGQHKQDRQKITAHQNQINPLISHSNQRIRMFAKHKDELQFQQCRKDKRVYRDLQFAEAERSLGLYKGRNIQWKRLSGVVQKYVHSECSPVDILSLKQNDAFFLASLAALSGATAIIDEIFDQELKISQFGAYKLNVSIKGKPQQIIIDDYLPVFADNNQRAVFTHIDPSNFWVVLLEKAYAKIHGSYQNISFGFAHQVLQTFSMSPCVYKLIMTDFRHQQQQKCWNTLQECAKMKYPTVLGSRKNFTCSAIIPNQSYCLKTCEVGPKKSQERRVLLWNVPGVQPIQQKGIKYEKEGAVICLTLIEFMRNFETIDVAHVRANFSSHFYEFKCGPKCPILHSFTLTQQGTLYLTLQRKSGEKGRLRIMLINCSNQGSYQFILGKKEQVYNDATLHIQRCKLGVYVVICESETECSAVLRVYSERPVPLIKFSGKKETLLQRTFMQLAHSSVSQQLVLSKQHNDWYLSKIYCDQLGLAFIAIHIDEQSALKCEISLSKRLLTGEGLTLVNKDVRDGYVAVVGRGESDILIFEFVGKDHLTYCFPPSHLQIKVIV